MSDEYKIADAKRIFMTGIMPGRRKIENLFSTFLSARLEMHDYGT
jgi:hypothetical protein